MLAALDHRKIRLGHLAVGLWVVLLCSVAPYLMAGHLLTLPKPDRSATEIAFARTRATDEQGRWLVVHVLYEECRCSQNVIAHLLTSARPHGTVERILWVGGAERGAELAARGFRVTRVTAEELAARFAIEAAPLLLVIDPEGTVRYSGGYTDRKQGAAIHDLAIIAGLQSGKSADHLPLFGCAVSRRMQRALNPLARLTDALK